jgi:hypothetical protein
MSPLRWLLLQSEIEKVQKRREEREAEKARMEEELVRRVRGGGGGGRTPTTLMYCVHLCIVVTSPLTCWLVVCVYGPSWVAAPGTAGLPEGACISSSSDNSETMCVPLVCA